MQRPKRDGLLLPSVSTSCRCARKGRCDTSSLIRCIGTQKAFCAVDLLLKQVQAGDSRACTFFQESLAAEDVSVLSLLVQGAKQRSEMAFRFLYEYYWPPIFTHIALMIGGSHEIASELTQETFLKAWTQLPKTNEETPRTFKAWLYQIANNLARDYFRQPDQSRSSLRFVEGAERVDEMGRNERSEKSFEGPENMVCETELVKEAFSQVKPRYREALWLEAFSNGTQAEKARQLHVREGTFSGYVHRGREELEAAYRRLAEDVEIHKEGGKGS
jgi:RNA polymerase sigma factor (sigma-70 family)